MTTNDGGRALPNIEAQRHPDHHGYDLLLAGGMTLRDYFAAAAMQGCLAARSDNTRFWDDKHLAGYAYDFYAMADAMLAIREVHK